MGFCRTCHRQYVELKVNERLENPIRCPCHAIGCKGRLSEADVENTVSVELFARFKELNLEDRKARLETHDWTEGEGACPKCFVIMYRYTGCDDMTCPCGHKFNWKK